MAYVFYLIGLGTMIWGATRVGDSFLWFGIIGGLAIMAAARWYQVASRPASFGRPLPGTKPISREPR